MESRWFALLFLFDSFVRDLHEQLVSCMNHLVSKLRDYQTTQAAAITAHHDHLREEVAEAQRIMGDLELLLQSPGCSPAAGRAAIRCCDQFFQNCVDISQCQNDYSYLEFVPAGRLYVRPEHMGYLRLCDAVPDEVELRAASDDQAVCNREFTAMICTNHANCTDAEPFLDVQMSDDKGSPVEFRVRNNNDGSYSVLFTPNRAAVHRLNVRLFGITVDSSPLEIPVVNETASANPVPDFGALNVRCSDNLTASCPFSVQQSGISMDQFKDGSPLDCSARSFAAPLPGHLDNSHYFAASISPHSAAESSPGNVGAGKTVPQRSLPGNAGTDKAVPMKQAQKDSAILVAFDDGDCEEMRGSLMRKKMEPTSTASSGGASKGAYSVPVSSCASGARLKFEDFSCQQQDVWDDFDSAGWNYCNFCCL